MLTVRTNRLPEADTRGRTPFRWPPICHAGRFDAVVVGGGTGGAVAAIVAGQEGLKTAVIEPLSFLGGIATGGAIHAYCCGHAAGIQHEIDRRTSEWNERLGGKASGFHPEARKLALQEMADAAGVRCFYGAHFVGAVMDGAAVRGVVAEDAEGLFWVEAGVAIDGTGDGDVAAAAGVPFRMGREGDGAPQPYSLPPGFIKNGDCVSFKNFDAGQVDPTHALDLTRAHFEGRSHLRRAAYDAESRLHYVAPLIGVREGRFIEAETVVTLRDQQEGCRFPDAVGYAWAFYDNHSRDLENESAEARRWVAVYGHWGKRMAHDIPYGSLVPRRVENLLVACRAAGMTHDAHNLWRMQRDIMALGEAAGVAAAVALRSGRTVRDVDVKAVQKRLVERKAIEPRVLEGSGQGGALPVGDEGQRPVPELLALFGTPREGYAIEELVRRGTAVHAELRAVLASGDANARLLAALALGLQGLRDGVPVLQETVRSRRADICQGPHMYPRWVGALNLLEELGLRETGSLDLVKDLLQDAALDVHRAVHAIRMLARHATAEEALQAIRAAQARRDVDCSMRMQNSTGGSETVQDRRFELDLAAAEAFATFGCRDEARRLAEAYTADPRALVRAYARRVIRSLGGAEKSSRN